MGTEDNPDVKIEYGSDTNIPPASWTDLIADAISFEIDDAGVLKVPVARIKLANKAGKYTSGATPLVYWRPIRIRTDIRGVYDTVFYGRLYRTEGMIKGKKIPELNLICRCLGRKLLEETITRAYFDMYDSGWWWDLTMKKVIEDFLLDPDSDINTSITLETDTGIIVTAPPQHNFRQSTLQDALRDICEKINYDGYVYVDATNAIKLWLKKIGTIAASPAITLNHPYIEVEPVFDIEEIKNHIFVWGDIDQGFPPNEEWTEKNITTNWAPYTGCTVSEDTTEKMVGNKSMKASRPDAASDIGAILTIPIAQSPVDCISKGLKALVVHLRHYHSNRPYPPIIILEDDLGDKIEFKSSSPLVSEKWSDAIYIQVGSGVEIQNDQNYPAGAGTPNKWYSRAGAPNFDWKIKKIEAWTTVTDPSGGNINVDGLLFSLPKQIDPIKYSELQRKAASFPYGRRVYHHEDKEIKSFAQAQAIGDYVLDVNSGIIKKFEVKVKGKTWAHISEYLTFNLPEYGITNELWRITEIKREWKRPKYLRTSLSLVPKDQFVGSQAYLADTMAGILKYR